MRRAAVTLLAVLLLAVVVVVGGYPVFVDPRADTPRPADAIFVVGGDAPEGRYLHGLELAHRGYAPTLVLSNPAGQVDEFCDEQGRDFTVECFTPDPPSTQGEARELGRLAAERGWQAVIVVTYTPHVSRARYLMERCFAGDLLMAEVPVQLSVPYWGWMYIYQGAGFAKALVQRGC
ncbi:YdcF family protein [[Mycobacterium] wendilense]|uniref:YdcF family protein n=1 Tax=[Mycobacterium] wendilense TaxID=3064284 RepID=A0ABN9NV39_9MYCO|nr:YdcF family protein [Mycolicibacterium sp. MU0050]CAJ1580298.1 YdcF family protein [Mycolicibacterium sp. MU0050]